MLNFIRITLLTLAMGTVASANLVSTLSISPENAAMSVGDTTTWTVQISNATDLYAWQFDLVYAPTLLDPLSGGTEDPFLASGGDTFFLAGDTSTPGSTAAVSDSLLTAVSGVSGSGDLATFTFTALANGQGTLTLENVILLDSGLNDIEFQTEDAQVSITPEPGTFGVFAALLAFLLPLFYWRRKRNARIGAA